MDSLRYPFQINTTDELANRIAEQATADSLWAPVRSFRSGRIGTDINAALADEASLRAANKVAEADATARRIDSLRDRQAMYAPRVARLEDIRGVGDTLSWAGAQIGQGAASALDPLAMAAAGQAVGSAMRAVPRLRGVSNLAPLAGAIGALGYNQRQMTGEMYDRIKSDPQALASMTPQEANVTANTYGLAAGALESVLPVAAGRALGGRALLRGPITTGFGARTAGGMAVEGTTELGQQALQQGVHTTINPARDTSGDFSENLNAFAGGAVGGGPFAAAGAAADHTYARAGEGAQRVREKAGEVVDLAAERGSQAFDQARDIAEDTYDRTGLKGVVDLGVQKGKSVWDYLGAKGDAVNNYVRDAQGRVNFPEALSKARQDVERYRLSADELNLLTEMPPADAVGADLQTWVADYDSRRMEHIFNRMEQLEASGVPEASAFADRLSGEDPIDRAAALDEAAEFLLDRSEAAHVQERAVALRALFGSAIQRTISKAVRGAGQAAKGAAFVGENLVEGARQGLSSKKNMQGTSEGMSYDAWDRWVSKNAQGQTIADAASLSPEELSSRKQRSVSHGEMLAAQVQRNLQGAEDLLGQADFARSIAYEINKMASSWGSKDMQATPAVLDAVARDMRGLFGAQAGVMVNRMAQTSHPAAREMFDQLQDRVEGWKSARSQRKQQRLALADQMLMVLREEQQRELRSDPQAMENMVDMVGEIARGRVEPARRKQVESAFGPGVLGQMLGIYNEGTLNDLPRQDIAEELGDVVDESSSEFLKEQAERSVGRGAGPSTYNFARTPLQSGRTPTAKNADPFAADEKGARPRLFRKDLVEDTAEGKPALEKKIQDLRSLHEGVSGALDVKAKSLAQVFKDLDYSEQQQLALYRDYLRQENLTQDALLKADYVQAVLDGSYKNAIGIAKLRKALKQFANQRFVAVTEQGTERAPTELSHGALVSLGKGGDKAMSFIRSEAMKAGKRGSAEYVAAVNKAVSEANLLTFQSAQGKNVMGRSGDSRDITISADRLVKWVRTRSGEQAREGLKAHEAYLRDLLDGIQSIMASGYTDSNLPTMTDAQGKAHSFKDALPPNLRLGLRKVSSLQAQAPTIKALERERALRVAQMPPTQIDMTADGEVVLGGDARRSSSHQRRVAQEQDKDAYVSDPYETAESTPYKTHISEDATFLDATTDERVGNFKTEREDLADRSYNKAADLTNLSPEEIARAAAESVKKRQGHAVAQAANKKREAVKKAEKPEASPRFTNRQIAEAVAADDFSLIKTDADADTFIATAKHTLDQLNAMASKAEKEGRDLSAGPANARIILTKYLNPGNTFDWASLYPSWKMDSAPYQARIDKALGRTAASEVAAQGPKSQSSPGGAKRNAQLTVSAAATDAQITAAKEYLERVLGNQIKSEFTEITGFSGEWIDVSNLLRVSTFTNAGIMDVTRHEALHAFFSKFIKNNPKAARVMASLTDDPRVVRRLEVLLKDEPEAIKQLADGEERLAYIYQFAMAGKLRLPASSGKTLMSKIRKFLRRVFQMVSDQERAVDLLYAFEAGKLREPSAAGRAIAATLDQGTWLTRGSRAMDMVTQAAAAMVVPAHTILLHSASPTARKIGALFYSNPGDESAGQNPTGYLNSRNQKMRSFENIFRDIVDGLDSDQQLELITAMQKQTPSDQLADPDVAAAKNKLHAFFERMHRYMTDEKGLRIGKISDNYFPRVYDSESIASDPSKFREMLLSKYHRELSAMAQEWNQAQDMHYAKLSAEAAALAPPKTAFSAEVVAQRLTSRIVNADGVHDLVLEGPMREDGVLRPWMSAGERRKLQFLRPEDVEPFLEKDLVLTLGRYVRQAVRAAEYSERFGRQGAKLDAMLRQAKVELEQHAHDMRLSGEFKSDEARDKWVARQYRDVANSAGAMEGSLGNDVSDTVRKLNSWATVYQNIRLLPLALFSSFVDPLGIIARGGEVKDAYDAFLRGMKGVVRDWGDMLRDAPSNSKKDHWEKLAEFAGVVDASTFSNLLNDQYGSTYHSGKAKRINEIMFKANGMEAWNRAMRVGATKSAVAFIERHHSSADKNSRRWMKELGVSNADLHFDDDGRLITDKRVLMQKRPDQSLELAEAAISKTHAAILRWVEGAILSPNAAQRPAWASDPHYGVFWHLKQFAYSFNETIMKRAVNEAKHGNALPLGVFAWYIPVMIAADVVKALAVGGGELPNYMQGYDLGDWMQHGVDRSGLLGKYQLLIDGINDPAGIPGPMFDQVIDIITEPAGKTLIDALPAHAVYERML